MSDSKAVDCQAGYESANTAMVVALSGANYIHDAFGLLEFCTTLSYEKMVIDNESVGMALRAVRGVDVNRGTIAADVIAQVDPGGHFFDQPQTAQHVRSEFFPPSLPARPGRGSRLSGSLIRTNRSASQKIWKSICGKPTPALNSNNVSIRTGSILSHAF